MKMKLPIVLCFFLVFTVFVISISRTTAALAQDGYEINWWTVDNGGGTSTSSGGEYELHGTIGEQDGGDLEGGEFDLQGGFWSKGIQAVIEYLVNLPLVLR